MARPATPAPTTARRLALRALPGSPRAATTVVNDGSFGSSSRSATNSEPSTATASAISPRRSPPPAPARRSTAGSPRSPRAAARAPAGLQAGGSSPHRGAVLPPRRRAGVRSRRARAPSRRASPAPARRTRSPTRATRGCRRRRRPRPTRCAPNRSTGLRRAETGSHRREQRVRQVTRVHAARGFAAADERPEVGLESRRGELDRVAPRACLVRRGGDGGEELRQVVRRPAAADRGGMRRRRGRRSRRARPRRTTARPQHGGPSHRQLSAAGLHFCSAGRLCSAGRRDESSAPRASARRDTRPRPVPHRRIGGRPAGRPSHIEGRRVQPRGGQANAGAGRTSELTAGRA